MGSPFQRPEPNDERWKLLDFMRPTEADDQSINEVVGIANEFLSWCSQPFHDRFVKWLERQSHEPVAAHADHMAMVAQATRCNVYREILQHLEREHKRAQVAAGGR